MGENGTRCCFCLPVFRAVVASKKRLHPVRRINSLKAPYNNQHCRSVCVYSFTFEFEFRVLCRVC